MPDRQTRPSRRGFMWGAATAGAAAAAVATLPAVPQPEAAAVTPEQTPKPERGGGYHVSEHVRQYYKTTLV